MKNTCLNCKLLNVDLKQLAVARLVPSTKLSVQCTKYKSEGAGRAEGTYENLFKLNHDQKCFIPNTES